MNVNNHPYQASFRSLSEGVVLHGHTSPDNAFLVDDYPYGRQLRCRIRYWVETATRGLGRGQQRWCRQTEHPRTLRWNKPKCEVYSDMVIMYQEKYTDHTKGWSLNRYMGPAWYILTEVCGLAAQLNDAEAARYDRLYTLGRQLNRPEWLQLWRMMPAVQQAAAAHPGDEDAAYQSLLGWQDQGIESDLLRHKPFDYRPNFDLLMMSLQLPSIRRHPNLLDYGEPDVTPHTLVALTDPSLDPRFRHGNPSAANGDAAASGQAAAPTSGGDSPAVAGPTA